MNYRNRSNFFALKTWVVVFIFSTTSLFAQIEWQNTFGGNGQEEITCYTATGDGGFVVAGYSNSGISGDKTDASFGNGDYWIVKLNSTGDIQWQRTIGGNNLDIAYRIIPTSDGGYCVGGVSMSDISGSKTENCFGQLDYWIIKLNAFGIIQWQNTIGGSDNDDFRDMVETPDGGFIIGGTSSSPVSGEKTVANLGYNDIWILKLSSSGAIVWQDCYGGNDYDDFRKITKMGNTYLIAGNSTSGISGEKSESSRGGFDYWLLRIHENGTVIWDKTIGGNYNESISYAEYTANNKIIVAGSSSSGISGEKTENSIGDDDYWVLQMDTMGALQWQNTIGGSGGDFLTDLSPSDDGGYTLIGSSASNASGDKSENAMGITDMWVVKINTTGTIEWENTVGGDSTDLAYCGFSTMDGGCVLFGSTASAASFDLNEGTFMGTTDCLALKLDPPCQQPSSVNPVAGSLDICEGSSTFLSVGNSMLNGANGWSWYLYGCDNILVGTGDTIIVNPTTSTSYFLRGEGGCADPFGPCYGITIDVHSCLGIDENENKISVFPNPTNGMVNIQSEATLMNTTLLTIFNPMGQIIEQIVLQNNSTSIDLSHLSSSTYYMEFSDPAKGSSRTVKQLILLR